MNPEIIANSIEKLAEAVKGLDATPTFTKKQWVREKAVQLAVGMMNPVTGTPMMDSALESIKRAAIEMATNIWDETRDLG